MIGELWQKHQTPEHVIRHMDAVAAYALQIIAGTKGNFNAERIRKDFERSPRSTLNRYRSSVMVTHLNEYAGIDTGCLAQRFETVYLSDGKTIGDIHILKRTGTQNAVRTAISA